MYFWNGWNNIFTFFFILNNIEKFIHVYITLVVPNVAFKTKYYWMEQFIKLINAKGQYFSAAKI